jgi:hypothetical protein
LNLGCGIRIRILTKQYEASILRFLALQIEFTIQIFWNQVYETNPRYESFEYRMDSRIRSTGFVWICESEAQDSYGFVLDLCTKICEDSLDSWKQVESFENWLDSYVRYETNLSKSGFVNHDTIQIEPFWSQDSYTRYGTNPCFYESLIRFPHP